MFSFHCTTRTILSNAFIPSKTVRTSVLPPAFLVPALQQAASFSQTSSALKPKDGNPKRGESALHRRLARRVRRSPDRKEREALAEAIKNLPQPVLNPEERNVKVETREDHGLYAFLAIDAQATGEPFMTPKELQEHGRSWAPAELRGKDWIDLHKLWWTCVKERNRIGSSEYNRLRTEPDSYGQFEFQERLRAIQGTMRNIRQVLLERWYAWENARNEAMNDPEVNMYAEPRRNQKVYTPTPEPVYEEEEPIDDEGLPAIDPAESRGDARA